MSLPLISHRALHSGYIIASMVFVIFGNLNFVPGKYDDVSVLFSYPRLSLLTLRNSGRLHLCPWETTYGKMNPTLL